MKPTLTASPYALVEVRDQATTAEQAPGGREHPPARRGDEGGPLGGPEVSGSGHVAARTPRRELARSREAPGQARLGDGKGRLGNGNAGDPVTRRGRS